MKINQNCLPMHKLRWWQMPTKLLGRAACWSSGLFGFQNRNGLFNERLARVFFYTLFESYCFPLFRTSPYSLSALLWWRILVSVLRIAHFRLLSDRLSTEMYIFLLRKYMRNMHTRGMVSIMMLLGVVIESSGFNWKFSFNCFNFISYYERFERPNRF